MKIQLLDVVVLKKAIPEQKLQEGAIGTVVEFLGEALFLVEFADKNGVPYTIVDLPEQLLIKVIHEPMASQV